MKISKNGQMRQHTFLFLIIPVDIMMENITENWTGMGLFISQWRINKLTSISTNRNQVMAGGI